MTSFLNRFASSISGVLSGFDRIRFRGTQRLLASTRGLQAFLSHAGVLLKDFKPYVTTITDRIRRETAAAAQQAGVAIEYLNDFSMSKEKLARACAKQSGRTTGRVDVGGMSSDPLAGSGYSGVEPTGRGGPAFVACGGPGEFLVNGFRNRDIRVLLFDRQAKNEEEAKQQSGVVTRMLRLLRAHGVIRKVSGTHRYQVTERGRELIAGLTLAYDANPLKLQTAA